MQAPIQLRPAMNDSGKPTTVKQRRAHAIATGVAFLAGSILFGALSFKSDPDHWLIFFLIGGVIPASFASGGILLVRFVAAQNSRGLAVACAVLSPITLTVILAIGSITLIPYFVYNLVVLNRTRNMTDTNQVEAVELKAKPIAWLVVGCVVACAFIWGVAYTAVQNRKVDQLIQIKSGYKPGSPDSAILRAYYLGWDGVDLAARQDYVYSVQHGALFVLAKRGGAIRTNIAFRDLLGNYKIDKETISGSVFKSAYSSGQYLRADLDKLFTNAAVANNGVYCFYMLIIDSRTDDEHWQDYLDSLGPSLSKQDRAAFNSDFFRKSTLDEVDRTYADAKELVLTDENGTPLQTLMLDDGRYVAYYGAMRVSDNKFEIRYSYRGQSATLLTNGDLLGCKINAPFSFKQLAPSTPAATP